MNLDLDAYAGDEGTGNGAPSSAFGGAASNPGFWNRVDASGPNLPWSLYGLDGRISGATVVATGFIGGRGGNRFTGNTGDYALLLNDFAEVGGTDDAIQYHFAGLLPGRYEVYTYAVSPTGRRTMGRVYIPGASDPLQFTNGVMPGNRFVLGVTHTFHDITITDDSLVIHVGGGFAAACNGFQLVLVPEPFPFLILGVGALWAARRRKTC